MSLDNIELISRFNDGAGGISLIVQEPQYTYERGLDGALEEIEVMKEHGTFLSLSEALELAADLVTRALPQKHEARNHIISMIRSAVEEMK